MSRNWILALTLAGLASAAAPAVVAQDTPTSDQQPAAIAPPQGGHKGPRFDPDRRAEMVSKKLNLSADQKTRVADIFKSEQEQMQKIHADASASQQDRRSKMMETHKASNDQVRALLNPDQQKKWDEMQARRELWQKGQQQPPDGSAPNTDQK